MTAITNFFFNTKLKSNTVIDTYFITVKVFVILEIIMLPNQKTIKLYDFYRFRNNS